MKIKIFFIICIFISNIFAYSIESDSVSIDFLGGAKIYKIYNDAPHALENGRAEIRYIHNFSSNFIANVGFKLSRISTVGLLEEANLEYKYKNNILKFGYLTSMEGEILIYDIHNSNSIFSDNNELCNYWGTGISYKKDFNNIFVKSDLMINNRESGLGRVQLGYKNQKAALLFSSGLISYDMQNNDNCLNSTFEFFYNKLNFKYFNIDFHFMALYNKFLGFDSKHNATMVPGYEYKTIGEYQIVFSKILSYRSLIYYYYYCKRYEETKKIFTNELDFRALKNFGILPKVEYFKTNNVDNLKYSLGLYYSPIKSSIYSIVSIGKTGEWLNSPKLFVEGSLWLNF